MESSHHEIIQRSFDAESKAKEQFVIKRTEIKDIYDFQSRKPEESVLYDYNYIEQVFETSYFSLTVIDNHTDSLAALFIFNDTPFGVIQKEGFPNIGGVWEPWFRDRFGDCGYDGKNSIWLVYFQISEDYSEDELKRIYHKVFLSSYTTLNQNSAVLMLLLKTQATEIFSGESSDIQLNQARIMLEYLYDEIYEVHELDIKNDFSVFLNKRIKVFPLIEIREGIQEDHDDLENIFKDQTPSEIVDSYEDFFIAKMIADQNSDNKVLVGQVNDKAIGMMGLSKDIDLELLAKSFELEDYSNLMKQDYMKAVLYKRKLIQDEQKAAQDKEYADLKKEYNIEVDMCKVISQRIFLQKALSDEQKEAIYQFLETWDKDLKKKSNYNRELAYKVVNSLLSGFNIREPQLDKFKSKFPIEDGTSLLTDEINFFLDTLELFGLKRGYMDGAGHFEDWEKKEAQKREEKEKQKEKIIAKSMKSGGFKTSKKREKPVEKTKKPDYFDFSPLSSSIQSFKKTTMFKRSKIRQIINSHRKEVAELFVDKNDEPTHEKCYNVNDILKALSKQSEEVKSILENVSELQEAVLPFLKTFGNLDYDQAVEQRVIEDERLEQLLKEEKKKAKKDKKDKKDKAKPLYEPKPVDVTVYNVSLSGLFEAVNLSFKFDKLMMESNNCSAEERTEIEKEIEIYKTLMQNGDIHKGKQTEFTILQDKIYDENLAESKMAYDKFSALLENYTNEQDLPPISKEVMNVFCVKLFFIEHAFESRSIDFLLKAFDMFPDCDYLVITQPHSFYESSLIENFTRATKRMNSLFPDMLFLMHRETLLVQLIQIDFTDKHNLMKSAFLFDKYIDNEEAFEKYEFCRKALEKESNYQVLHAKIENNIIGIFVISKEANVDYYDSHFNVRDFINIDNVLKYNQSRICFVLLNKNFRKNFKVILKEIGRKANKITFYYEIPKNTYIASFVSSMYFLRNRKFPQFIVKKQGHTLNRFFDEKIKDRTDMKEREEIDNQESDFSLVMNSKNLLSNAKIINNNRIVVVGSSDTGLSFIDTLLSLPYSSFTHIYLISPGGLLYHHISDEIFNLKVPTSNFNLEELKKLMLEKRVKIINLKVVDINRTEKFVKFNDGTVLLYDYLVLTLGLQDSLWRNLKFDLEKEIELKFAEIKTNLEQTVGVGNKEFTALQAKIKSIKEQPKVISVDQSDIYQLFSAKSKFINSLIKNKRFEIILYGRSLNLMTFIQGLLMRGVPAQKINLVIPGLTHIGTKDEKIKKESMMPIDDLNLLNNNTFEKNPELENYLIQSIVMQGVKIYNNYKFDSVTLNEAKDAISSFDFVQETESSHPQQISASLIVTGGILDIDSSVFHFIHDNGLVYNGRMIIDKQFCTADPYIYAAGRLCEFSQRYSFTEKNKLLKLES